MSIVELFMLAVGLSMDAFAVSICKGLSLRDIKVKHMVIAGLEDFRRLCQHLDTYLEVSLPTL